MFKNTQVYDIRSDNWTIDGGVFFHDGIAGNTATILDDNLHSIGGANINMTGFSIHRIASLCGVYVFSGSCDDLNRCTVNDTCQSDGKCIGTCISLPGCNCTPVISTSTAVISTSTASSISLGAIVGIIVAILVFVGVFSVVATLLLLKYKRKRQSNNEEEPVYQNSSNFQIIQYENIKGEIELPKYSETPSAVKEINPHVEMTLSTDYDTYIIPMSRLKILKQIGEGAFGCVYLGVFNRTEVAIKQLSKKDPTEEDIKEFLAEAKIMRKLPVHPNVVLFRGVTLSPDPLSIVTDFCNGGSLSIYLENNPNMPISEKVKFIKDIAKGMLHLHHGVLGKEVIHRDLATRNILLKNGVAVITDFGLSRVKSSMTDYQKTQHSFGPLKWMSPESLFESKYSIKSDVFSFGVVIYEIFTTEKPWKDLTIVEAVQKVENGERMILPKSCECSLALKNLMERCWAQEPDDRPNFEEICDFLEKIDEKGNSLV